MADKPSRTVARDVKLGHHADASVSRVDDQFADFLLRIVQAVGAALVQLWIFLALDPEALVFGQVPMKDVHLHGFQAVEIAANDLQGNEVSRRIDHQAAPGKARLVANGERRRREPVAGNVDKLQKRLQSMHRSKRCGCGELRARAGYFQYVGFVLTHILNFLAGVIGVDEERCRGRRSRTQP